MSTLAKLLKDNNGNVILPKTRAEQVYLSDNTSLTTKLSDLSSQDITLSNNINTLTTKVNSFQTYSNQQIVHVCTHIKSGTTHSLTSNTTLPTEGIAHLSFLATADFTSGDSIEVNTVAYVLKTLSMEDYSGEAFKNGALVSVDINVTNHYCFFKLGGSSEPPIPAEPPDNTSACTIIRAFTSNTTWTVPDTTWYRIICVGKSGNGGSGGSYGSASGVWAGNGAGGNAGGMAAGIYYLEKDTQIQVTVNSSITSFGEYMSTSYGGNGGNGGSVTGGNRGTDGVPSTIIGGAYGGNKLTMDGKLGYTGSQYTEKTYYSYGGWFSSSIAFINQYIASNSYCAGAKSYSEKGASAPTWSGLVVKISGGGGGGHGGLNAGDGDRYGGTAGGTGSPAVCIIEKMVK